MKQAYILLTYGIFAPATSFAHGMDGGRMTIQLAGNTAYVVATPAAQLFMDLDDDVSGVLEPAELQAHRAVILQRFQAVLGLTDAQGRAGEVIFGDVSYRHPHGGRRSVRIALNLEWERAPKALALRYRGGSIAPLQMAAQRLTPGSLRPDQRSIGPVTRRTLSGREASITFLGETS